MSDYDYDPPTAEERGLLELLAEAHAAIRDLEGYLEGNIPWDQVEALRAKHASAIRRARGEA